MFNRARHLERNWRNGVYFVCPVLKGHKGCVSAFDSNGTAILYYGMLNIDLDDILRDSDISFFQKKTLFDSIRPKSETYLSEFVL